MARVYKSYRIRMNLRLDDADAKLYDKLGPSIFGLLDSVNYNQCVLEGSFPINAGVLDVKSDQCDSNNLRFLLNVEIEDFVDSVPSYTPSNSRSECCDKDLCAIDFGEEENCLVVAHPFVRKYVLYINACDYHKKLRQFIAYGLDRRELSRGYGPKESYEIFRFSRDSSYKYQGFVLNTAITAEMKCLVPYTNSQYDMLLKHGLVPEVDESVTVQLLETKCLTPICLDKTPVLVFDKKKCSVALNVCTTPTEMAFLAQVRFVTVCASNRQLFNFDVTSLDNGNAYVLSMDESYCYRFIGSVESVESVE